jgi:hypothetical protein
MFFRLSPFAFFIRLNPPNPYYPCSIHMLKNYLSINSNAAELMQ